MKEVTYITGNQKKREYLGELLDFPILHQKINLDEIQSLDLQKIVKHKVRQAYDIIKKPVVVEDTGPKRCFGKFTGPFIKFFP